MDREKLFEVIASLVKSQEILDSRFAVTKSLNLSNQYRKEGNDFYTTKHHDKSTHRNILMLFTKSIAFAPADSEELALGYTNRALLLQHLKKYDLCILDLDRALSRTKSILLKAKLLNRKVECLVNLGDNEYKAAYEKAKQFIEMIEDKDNKDIKIKLKGQLELMISSNERLKKPIADPEPSPPTLPIIKKYSEEIPCASDAVELKYNQKFGRHLIVNRKIDPGEVLIIEDGYVVNSKIKQTYLVCSFCSNYTYTGIPCDSCPCVIYCSEKCKNRAWNKYHDIECLLLATNYKAGNLNMRFMLMFRILMTALKEKNIENGINYILEEQKVVQDSSDNRTKGFKDGKFQSNIIRALCSLQRNQGRINAKDEAKYQEDGINILRLLNCSFMTLNKKYNFKKVSFQDASQCVALHSVIVNIIKIIDVNNYSFQASDCSCNVLTELDFHEHCERTGLGNIIALCCSLMNHSCTANSDRIFRDGKMIICANRPIEKNEQLFCSYGPNLGMKRSKRQVILYNNYYFSCDCQPCTEDWSTEDYEEHYLDSREAFYNWALPQPGFIKLLEGKLISEREFKNLELGIVKLIKNIYKQNSTYEAEMKSCYYRSYLHILGLCYYGNSQRMFAKC